MKQLEIEKALKKYTTEELAKLNYEYSVNNFLLDTDEPYRAAILDFFVNYERLGNQVGPSGFCGKINYVISFQVPLASTEEEEAREEAMRIQFAIATAVLRVERCKPVKRIEKIGFIKSVLQDQYRSLEKPGALMIEIVCSIELEYQEEFYL